MREIKFRAWDKINQKMIYPNPFESMPMMMTWEGLVYKNGELQSYELLQFTGLKDKNRKEIYEGDIVTWGGSHDKDLCVIVYDAPCFVLEIKSECVDKDSRVDRYDLRDIEVIGNMWEHPHLLK